jgi:hypothetical protein
MPYVRCYILSVSHFIPGASIPPGSYTHHPLPCPPIPTLPSPPFISLPSHPRPFPSLTSPPVPCPPLLTGLRGLHPEKNLESTDTHRRVLALFGHKYQHCDGTHFSIAIFKFQYWEVASSSIVGTGLLMGYGTWALWHCPLNCQKYPP